MKLLMISGDRSILAGKRGAFWYTLEEFSKHWERIDIICPHVALPSPADGGWAGVRGNVFFHPTPRGLWYQPWWIRKIGQELVAAHRHDIATVHDYPPFYNGLGACLLKRKTKLPYAIEIHHIVGYPRPSGIVERIAKVMSYLFLAQDARHAAAVRTVNREVAETLIRWGVPRSKVAVVPSAYLDHELFAKLPVVSQRYDFAFCARLVANKGLKNALRALAMVPDATMVVIGDGPERSSSERLARDLKIEHRVEFLGWLTTQEEVFHALRASRALVMNSLSEGGPRVALEAMASGVPVISTRVGLMPELILDGQNGLFTTGEPNDLAEKMKLILSDAALRGRMGEAARGVLERFERKTLIKRYADFLKTITAS